MRGLVPGVGWSCDAFGDVSIPTSILASSVVHDSPLAGDNGLVFEPVEAEDEMPPVSESQRRLMWAAASGHGNSGVPKSVGKEFAAADPGGKLPATTTKDMAPEEMGLLRRLMSKFLGEEAKETEHNQGFDGQPIKGRAASVAFTTSDGRVLLVKRGKDEENYPDTWALPGGQVEDGEDYETAAKRECQEELGDCGQTFDGLKELDRTRTPNDFEHVTYAVPIKDAFDPKLNAEHSDFLWAPVTKLPEPIHPGVRKTIDGIILGDSTIDPDRRVVGKNQTYKYPAFDSLAHDEMPFAMDRRVIDDDGRLHVNGSIITSAQVNPYLGREIPGFEELGLDPDKKYMLYRDPAELEKSVASFNGIPILSQHQPVNADAHPKDLVIGAVSNPRWESPNIVADLVFWAKDAIDEIQNGKKADLSAGYAYKPVMSATNVDGKQADGVMSDIVANHLAQVSQGRVTNAHVADSMEEMQWEAIAAAIMAA
jgi:8-oxo-dGTP pyrophosphatase MutT (NUDIX family)